MVGRPGNEARVSPQEPGFHTGFFPGEGGGRGGGELDASKGCMCVVGAPTRVL